MPALFIRERAIDIERLNRTLSLLECIDDSFAKEGKRIVKGFQSQYSSDIFRNIGVSHL